MSTLICSSTLHQLFHHPVRLRKAESIRSGEAPLDSVDTGWTGPDLSPDPVQ